jgi:hypothetical protein
MSTVLWLLVALFLGAMLMAWKTQPQNRGLMFIAIPILLYGAFS